MSNIIKFTDLEKLIIKLSMNLAIVALNPSKSEKAKEMVYIYAEQHNYTYQDALDISNSIDAFLLEDSSK